MAHEIFISYAAEDKPVADAVCYAIESSGIQCWYAPRDVTYGQDFEEAIVDAICASRLIILIVSANSNSSSHVKREVQNACMEGVAIPVLPFRVQDVPLNKALQYYIGSVHWLDAATPPMQAHLQRLVEHVRARLPRLEPPVSDRTTSELEPQTETSTSPELGSRSEEKFGAATAAATTPLSSRYTTLGLGNTGASNPGWQAGQSGPLAQTAKNDPFAIASLVCGVIPCTCLPSILAIIFGHIALSRIRKSPELYKGKGMAKWGVGLGYVFTVANILYGIISAVANK
jgi:hypothetical protein